MMNSQYTPSPPPVPILNQPETSFAITSMVLGIVGILTFWLYGIIPILAIIFGSVSISRSRNRQMKPSGMAIAGLVLGIIEISFVALIVLIALSL